MVQRAFFTRSNLTMKDSACSCSFRQSLFYEMYIYYHDTALNDRGSSKRICAAVLCQDSIMARVIDLEHHRIAGNTLWFQRYGTG